MNKPMRRLSCTVACGALLAASGCATASPPAPLSYVAAKRPNGPIKAGGQPVETTHSKDGLYFFNAGFRPAADVGAYIEKAQADAGSDVLRNADVQLNVPFAIDILLFGVQVGSDVVKANQ